MFSSLGQAIFASPGYRVSRGPFCNVSSNKNVGKHTLRHHTNLHAERQVLMYSIPPSLEHFSGLQVGLATCRHCRLRRHLLASAAATQVFFIKKVEPELLTLNLADGHREDCRGRLDKRVPDPIRGPPITSRRTPKRPVEPMQETSRGRDETRYGAQHSKQGGRG